MNSNTRDANLPGGIQSGTTFKEAIGGEKGKLSGKPLPDKIDGAWPKATSQKVGRGHTWKNG